MRVSCNTPLHSPKGVDAALEGSPVVLVVIQVEFGIFLMPSNPVGATEPEFLCVRNGANKNSVAVLHAIATFLVLFVRVFGSNIEFFVILVVHLPCFETNGCSFIQTRAYRVRIGGKFQLCKSER